MRFAKVTNHGLTSGAAGAIRVGCLPSFSAIGLLVALRKGFLRQAGLDVEVSCEPGAAALRDRLALGDLDAGIGNAGLLYLTYHGWSGTGVRRPFLTGLMVSGGALELVASPSFAAWIASWESELLESGTIVPGRGRGVRRVEAGRPWTLAVDQESSASQFAILRWMEAHRLTPGAGFRLVIVPPSLMSAALSAGHIDACCAAAPWTTQAVVTAGGRRVDLGTAAVGSMPESAVMVARDFVQDRASEHLRLLAALMDGIRFCSSPRHRSELLALLVSSRWFEGVSESTLDLALDAYAAAVGADPVTGGIPSRERGEWIAEMVSVTRGLVPARRVPRELVSRLFRRDLHTQACVLGEGACATQGPGVAGLEQLASSGSSPSGVNGADVAGGPRVSARNDRIACGAAPVISRTYGGGSLIAMRPEL